MFNDESQDTSPEIEVQDENIETQEEETTEPEATDWEAEAKKWRGIAQRNLKKTEKAEQTPAQNTLSAVDILAVSKAGIEPEDLEDVVEYAKFKNIPLHEALKSTVIKATLAEKNELRKSADATNTSSARRGNAAVSDDRLLADAAKGDLPDSEDDLKRLIALRAKARRG